MREPPRFWFYFSSAKAFDSRIGYRFGRYNISLNGYNLTNQRPPVTQSEFGDLSYYLLPARTIFLNLTASF